MASGGQNLPSSWPADQLNWQRSPVPISKGKLKPGYLGGQALIRRERMLVTKATCKHQIFLSPLLLCSGQLPNSPPTLVNLRERCQERMKTSYHSLRKSKRLREKKEKEKKVKKNHYSWLYQQRDFHNKYRKTYKSSQIEVIKILLEGLEIQNKVM